MLQKLETYGSEKIWLWRQHIPSIGPYRLSGRGVRDSAWEGMWESKTGSLHLSIYYEAELASDDIITMTSTSTHTSTHASAFQKILHKFIKFE